MVARAMPPKPDHAQGPIAQLAAHVAAIDRPIGRPRTSRSLTQHMMGQGDHPADGRLGHRTVHGAGGDEHRTSACVQAATSTAS